MSIRVIEGDNLFINLLVPRAGIEPARLAAPDFESGASTSSTTEARLCKIVLETAITSFASGQVILYMKIIFASAL
jgi:hypothetical protein